MKKKLFKHGGSYAVDLPVSFVRELGSRSVTVEVERGRIVISASRELDSIEAEPEFKAFVASLLRDAMKRPEKLRDAKDVWKKEWKDLLKGVPVDGD